MHTWCTFRDWPLVQHLPTEHFDSVGMDMMTLHVNRALLKSFSLLVLGRTQMCTDQNFLERFQRSLVEFRILASLLVLQNMTATMSADSYRQCSFNAACCCAGAALEELNLLIIAFGSPHSGCCGPPSGISFSNVCKLLFIWNFSGFWIMNKKENILHFYL